MKPRGSYAIADLTDVYSDYAESSCRGAKLDNYRRTVTVQDEIIMKEPSEYYWFAHTTADIEITDGGKTGNYWTSNSGSDSTIANCLQISNICFVLKFCEIESYNQQQ